MPESMCSVSLVMLVHSTTGSYSSAGIAAGGFAIGSALAAPVVGRGLDRLAQRKLLVGMAVAFAAALVTVVFTTAAVPEAVTISLATAAGLARPPLDAAVRALWPRIVTHDRLQAIYSLDATLQELIWIAGPLMLSALILLGGPSLPLVACAALALAGTLLYASSHSVQAPAEADGGRARGSLRSTNFNSLCCAATLYGVAVGILTVTLTAFATNQRARAVVGVLVAIWGIGSMLGGVAYGTTRWRAQPERRAIVLLGLFALLLALLAMAPSLGVLAALMLALGLPLSPWLGTLNEAVQTLVPRSRTTEAFTWIFALITIGIAAGNAAGGPIIQHAGTKAGFLVSAAAAAAGAALGGLGLLFSERGAASQRVIESPNRP
jgi:predicted MFS family arabinose efflux permease